MKFTRGGSILSAATSVISLLRRSQMRLLGLQRKRTRKLVIFPILFSCHRKLVNEEDVIFSCRRTFSDFLFLSS